jgi:GTP-binding protein HflX
VRSGNAPAEAHLVRSAQARLDEAAGLALAIDLIVTVARLREIRQLRRGSDFGKSKG